MKVMQKLPIYALLIRLDKPIGTFLLLWPTLWALWLAGQGQPDGFVVMIFVIGVFLMRSAGGVINDIADRDLDPHVERTRDRPLAAGKVSVSEAVMVFVVLCLLAFICVLTLNALTIKLAVIGVLLTISYPFMKRFHPLPQVHLGAAFGWSIPMAYGALTNQIPATAWLLFIANIVWSVVYDTMYAMVDRDDDLKMGMQSTAILFGDRDRRILGALQEILLALLILVGMLNGLGTFYYVGLLAAAGSALYQQFLIAGRRPDRCFQAFLNNNWFGLAVFGGLLVDFLP